MSTAPGSGPERSRAAGPLFPGDGEMAAVMAATDWSASPVGPPESWPDLLRSMVNVLLTSRFSMWLGWGEELTFFYNDAYRRDTLGVKHPWALGRRADEVWSEIWGDIGPRCESVMRDGRATWDEALPLFLERSGYREETYHTFSYSPLHDSTGTIVGLLCVVSEETERVLSERRMATLRDVAAELSGVRTEPEVLAAVGRCLGGRADDLPFALTYLLDGSGGARLACASGIPVGHPAAPERLESFGAGPWPVAELLAGSGPILVDDLGARLGELPTGVWDDPPDRALLVPLAERGEQEAAGFFVAALNPYRPADAGLRGFVGLLAGEIAAAVANARAYDAERRRAEALAELDRAKTEFFSNVSHEFRTPLTLILGPAEDALADDGEALGAAQRQRIEIVQRNARRLRRLVNDMLDFARIEGGRLKPQTVTTDLTAFTGDVVRAFAPAVERAGLALRVDLAPLAGPVELDPDLWEKIVLNLLSNALKFTLAGEIGVRLADVGGAVEFAVTDTGVGVPVEELPHVFERFHRAPRHAARSYEGTGIGLALVAELVRLHGGEVAAESVVGEGSRFSVRIPYGEPSGAAGVARPTDAALVDEALQWGAPTGVADAAARRALAGSTAAASVLVVEDNADMRNYLVRILEPYWKVAVAADGQEALEQIAQQAPDLVLTDVMMPRLDGFALLSVLRNDVATATIPVVMLSARAGEEAAVEGLDAGADDYLVKPFSAIELVARVRANLELAGMRNDEAAWRRALVASLEDAVLVLDAQGVVVEANAAFERTLGFPASDVPYAPPFPWVPAAEIEPDEHAQVMQFYAELLEFGHLSVVLPLRHRDGHTVITEIWAHTVGSGETRRTVVVFTDITARLAARGREAALARFGMRLAEESEQAAIEAAALDELAAIFDARASALVALGPEGAIVRNAGRPLSPEILGCVRNCAGAAFLDATGAVATDVDEPVRVAVAPLEPIGGRRRAVVLEFATRALTADERALLTVLAGYLGQALERARLFEESRAVATALQRSILGPTTVPETIAVRYFPAERPLEVGGDWYDVVELEDGRLALVVGDCTGRGLDAATTMGQLRSACRALLLEARAPGAVLQALDDFAARLPSALCTTVFCAVLDPAAGRLSYSCAGHVPPLLVAPDGESVLLEGASSLPLGVLPGTARPVADVTLVPGATLVCYTDGLVERRDEPLDAGLERLRAALGSATWRSTGAVADSLLDALLPEEGQEDDIAIVVYRHPGGRFARLIAADARALAPLRAELRGFLRTAGLSEDVVAELLVASGEACANAVEHAHDFSGEDVIELEAIVDPTAVTLRVRDRGQWRPPMPSDERGRGLVVMRGLVDELDVSAGESGTTVTLVRRRP